MDLNELAKEIAKREKGKEQVNIAQIKEIISVLGDILYEVEDEEFWHLLDKIMKWRLWGDKDHEKL